MRLFISGSQSALILESILFICQLQNAYRSDIVHGSFLYRLSDHKHINRKPNNYLEKDQNPPPCHVQ